MLFIRAIVNFVPNHFLHFPLARGSSDLNLQLNSSNYLQPSRMCICILNCPLISCSYSIFFLDMIFKFIVNLLVSCFRFTV